MSPLPLENTTFRSSLAGGSRYASAPSTGLTGESSAATTFIDMSNETDMIGVVDSIYMACVGDDGGAAGNANEILVACNGTEMKFQMPANSGSMVPHEYTWNVNGNLIVKPGQTLTIEASTGFISSASVRWRKMSSTEAGRLGIFTSIPSIAVATDVHTNGESDLVAAVSGKSIEILAIAITGSCYSATASSYKLQFTDGASDDNIILNVRMQRNDTQFHPPILIGNCRIRGDTGLKLTTTADAQTDDGAVSCNVLYRYVDDHETYNPDGTMGSQHSDGKAKYFWFHSATASDGEQDMFDNTIIGTDTVAHFDGVVCSHSNTGGICHRYIGTGTTTPLSEVWVSDDSDGAGASQTFVRENMDLPIHLSRDPSFHRNGASATQSFLCWGELRSGVYGGGTETTT